MRAAAPKLRVLCRPDVFSPQTKKLGLQISKSRSHMVLLSHFGPQAMVLFTWSTWEMAAVSADSKDERKA